APPAGTNGVLINEIRRNLAVYAGQAGQQPVRALYVAADGEQGLLRDRLLDTLAIPVYGLDPFAGSEHVGIAAGQRGGFSGAVGLLYAQAQKAGLPINFVKPKEPKPPKDPNRRRVLVAAVVAAALLLGIVVFGYAQIAAKENELRALGLQKTELDAQLLQLGEDAQRIKALNDWNNNQVVWLDELYDLADNVPDVRS